MTGYLSLLERKAEMVSPPADSIHRTLDLYRARQRRRRRRRQAASAIVAVLVFGAGLVGLLRAFQGGAGPARRPVPLPIGLAPPHIGPVRSIQPLTPGRAIASTRHSVILTTDGGHHWTDVSPRGMAGFSAASAWFLDPHHGWIVGVGGHLDPPTAVTVLRTRDGGRSWRRMAIAPPRSIGRFLDGQVPQIGFSDPLHGWLWFDMVSPAPLFVTSDGGATWQRGPMLTFRDQGKSLTFTSPTDGWAVLEHDVPLDPRTDLEIDRLYRTSDGGRTWDRVLLPAAPKASKRSDRGIELGAVEVVDPGVAMLPAYSRHPFAYLSSDGGATWSPTPPFPVRQGLGSPIFIESFVSHSTWSVASTSGQFATTTDAGRTWSVRDLRDVFPRGPSGLAFSNERTGWGLTCRWYSGDLNQAVECPDGASQLWRTDDGGRTWTLILADAEAGSHR